MTTPGDCFPTAINLASAMAAENPSIPVLVVQGLPVGQGAENAGLRYWHSWVELLPPGGEWAVADYANGRKITTRRRDYYRLGKIRQHLLWRFTLPQALAALEAFGHAGPWMDREKADALDETGVDLWQRPQPVENPVGER